jgi:hypothetical protein
VDWRARNPRTFTAATVQQVYELIEQRKARGKLVVEIG